MGDLKNYVSYRKQKQEIYLYYEKMYQIKTLRKIFHGSLRNLKALNESKRYSKLEKNMKVQYFRDKAQKRMMQNILDEWKFQAERVNVVVESIEKIRVLLSFEKLQNELQSQERVISYVAGKHMELLAKTTLKCLQQHVNRK